MAHLEMELGWKVHLGGDFNRQNGIERIGMAEIVPWQAATAQGKVKIPTLAPQSGREGGAPGRGGGKEVPRSASKQRGTWGTRHQQKPVRT